MPIIANFLNGLGGKGYGLSHAQKTAELYDGINISMIEVSSLTLVPKTPLHYQKLKGKFVGDELIDGIQKIIALIRNVLLRRNPQPHEKERREFDSAEGFGRQ